MESRPKPKPLGPSYLTPGFTHESSEGLYEWVAAAAATARSRLDMATAEATLWSYRHGGHEVASLGIGDATDTERFCVDMLPSVDGLLHLDQEVMRKGYEIAVPDMAEAIHIAGMLLRTLGLRAEIGTEPMVEG